MKACRETYHWEYLLTQKDTRQKKLDEGFEWIKSGDDAIRQTNLCKEKGTGFFANHVEELILAGRGRWKIENEGFNNQKNGPYRIEHLNSKNSNAMKNHYRLTQISDILMQLYLAWNPYIKELKQTIKNTSSGLLESFRRLTVTQEDVFYTLRYTTMYLE